MDAASTLGRDSIDTQRKRLPAYTPALAAYHRAFAGHLQRIVGVVPLDGGERAVDVACGDGVYSAWLAERIGPRGMVAAVDIAPACLELTARTASATHVNAARVVPCRASALRLPLADGRFDLAWCAQSLYSLSEPERVLHEMLRVVRPGGLVAVLENDNLHHLLLPWPEELELAVLAAQRDSLQDHSRRADRYYIARRLAGMFESLGLERVRAEVFAETRQAPWSDDERLFLADFLQNLRSRAAPRLASQPLRELDEFADPDHKNSLLHPGYPGAAMVVLDWLVYGFRPENSAQARER